MTKKTRPVAHMTLSDVYDELQILEYIATNTREGLTEGDRLFLEKLLKRLELLKDASAAEQARSAMTSSSRRPPPGLFEKVIFASRVTRAAGIELDGNDTDGKVREAIRRLTKDEGGAP